MFHAPESDFNYGWKIIGNEFINYSVFISSVFHLRGYLSQKEKIYITKSIKKAS